MEINDDFQARVVITPDDMSYVSSPSPGVERIMLDRIGGEVARATSIVRYAPGSEFPPHVHTGGEEYLVLEGVFSDEHGDFPTGSYVRNPMGTRHAPFTRDGATILVKLWQFQEGDDRQFAVDTRAQAFVPGLVDGLSVLPLHSFGTENVALVRWAPGTRFKPHRHWGGEEIYVIEGTFADEHGVYPAGSWLRNPDGSDHTPFTTEEGALIYVKTGHLIDGSPELSAPGARTRDRHAAAAN